MLFLLAEKDTGMRTPAATGYYTQNPDRLRTQIETLLSKEDERDLVPKMLIAPCDTLGNSGQVAAIAYSSVDLSQFQNAVILGSHDRDGPDLAVSEETWKTPLGTVEADDLLTTQLHGSDLVEHDEKAFKNDVSIEMQLIFLQCVLDDFTVCPLLVSEDAGDDSIIEAADLLADRLEGPDLVIVSTNLASHTGDDAQERVMERDRAVVDGTKGLDMERRGIKHSIDYLPCYNPLKLALDTTKKRYSIDHFTLFRHRTVTEDDAVQGYLSGALL